MLGEFSIAESVASGSSKACASGPRAYPSPKNRPAAQWRLSGAGSRNPASTFPDCSRPPQLESAAIAKKRRISTAINTVGETTRPDSCPVCATLPTAARLCHIAPYAARACSLASPSPRRRDASRVRVLKALKRAGSKSGAAYHACSPVQTLRAAGGTRRARPSRAGRTRASLDGLRARGGRTGMGNPAQDNIEGSHHAFHAQRPARRHPSQPCPHP